MKAYKQRELTDAVSFFQVFYVFVLHSTVTICFIIIRRYPPEARYVVLKIFMFSLAAVMGMLVGKFFIHKFLFCRVLKLRMFSEEGQGSWMVMFLTVLMFLFVMSFIYSEFLLLGGEHLAPYVTSHNLGIQNQTFMKMAAIGTWLGDFITAWMVTDMMLQVKQTDGQRDETDRWKPGADV